MTWKTSTWVIHGGIAALLLICMLAPAGSAVTLSIQNLTLASSGMNGSAALILDSAPDGIAGYKVNVSMATPGVAHTVVVDFPTAFSGMKSNSPLPAEEVKITAVDLSRSVQAGATNVTLCTLTVTGDTSGSTLMQPVIGELTDDNGDPVDASVMPGMLVVGSSTPTPVPSPTPTPTLTPSPSPTGTPDPTPTPSPTGTPVPTPTPTPGVVDFTATPRSGGSPLSVTFTPLVNTSVSGYIWSFGDGTSSDLPTPTHLYTTGVYPVTLLAQFAGGGSASTSKPGYICVSGTGPTPVPTCTVIPTPTPVPLIANFSADPVAGAPPLTVQFTDLTTGGPTKWRWNFGDGTLSTMRNPIHVYGGIGRYTVTLEVENRDSVGIVRKTEFIKTSGPKR